MTDNVSLPERLEATFLTSSPDLKRCPPIDGAEVAFAGRSNAGKSSVLNQLTGNRRTAKVSKTPGRTQLLNFFDVRTGGRLVDLPGYGYAKAGKEAQKNWQNAVNRYLSYRDALSGIVLVMDIRHPNQTFDQEMLNWAEASELPIHVLLNKADKLSFGAQKQAVNKIQKLYKTHPTASFQGFSATGGQGKPELIGKLLDWLSTPIEPII
jgi:GTP-binding protein